MAKVYPVVYANQSGRLDISGCRFGRLLVLSYSHTDKERKAHWLCQCDCGAQHTTGGKSLRNGSTQSCGCLQVEKSKKANTTHGQARSRLHRIWCAMKGRTTNPTHSRFSYYGARGIKVCTEWLDDFAVFREWALSNGYKSNLTIERVDVNGNYIPENCSWVTIEEQQRNKRNNLKYQA